MAKIVEPPPPRRVPCDECRAVIEYLPEEVRTGYASAQGERITVQFIACPRPGCPGQGVISRE